MMTAADDLNRDRDPRTIDGKKLKSPGFYTPMDIAPGEYQTPNSKAFEGVLAEAIQGLRFVELNRLDEESIIETILEAHQKAITAAEVALLEKLKKEAKSMAIKYPDLTGVEPQRGVVHPHDYHWYLAIDAELNKRREK